MLLKVMLNLTRGLANYHPAPNSSLCLLRSFTGTWCSCPCVTDHGKFAKSYSAQMPPLRPRVTCGSSRFPMARRGLSDFSCSCGISDKVTHPYLCASFINSPKRVQRSQEAVYTDSNQVASSFTLDNHDSEVPAECGPAA